MIIKLLVALGLFCGLAGCSTTNQPDILYGDLPSSITTSTVESLYAIPKLNQPKITIAVYNFPDRTGQRKPNTKFSQLSTAVTQGAEVWVISALKAVGGGEWFKVVERQGLDSLIKERQLIRSTRELYDGETDKTVLKPLVFAGLIIEGGVVGYDSNIMSGGVGARYFGIGVKEQYRVDQVTVSLRVVAVQTGEVLVTVSASKTIASHSKGGDVFRFLDMSTKALELETGVATNEPVNYAVRSTIEYAVLKMIHEGIACELWTTIDEDYNKTLSEIKQEKEDVR
jgi:curli production assembly/transport component CsgG|tara:strand:- start:109 stop:960 length:852 start_codon:yes stop_codon:yes gene_type:complete